MTFLILQERSPLTKHVLLVTLDANFTSAHQIVFTNVARITWCYDIHLVLTNFREEDGSNISLMFFAFFTLLW